VPKKKQKKGGKKKGSRGNDEDPNKKESMPSRKGQGVQKSKGRQGKTRGSETPAKESLPKRNKPPEEKISQRDTWNLSFGILTSHDANSENNPTEEVPKEAWRGIHKITRPRKSPCGGIWGGATKTGKKAGKNATQELVLTAPPISAERTRSEKGRGIPKLETKKNFDLRRGIQFGKKKNAIREI